MNYLENYYANYDEDNMMEPDKMELVSDFKDVDNDIIKKVKYLYES